MGACIARRTRRPLRPGAAPASCRACLKASKSLLLVMHAKPRVVRRDGMRFQGLRSSHATLAAYVGDAVTMRYDPRDLAEIRVFHHEPLLCRAVSEAHAGEVVPLKDIQAARRAHRRALRTTMRERVARVVDFLPVP